MGTINDFSDNFDKVKRDAIKNAILNRLGDDIINEMEVNGSELIVNTKDETYEFINTSDSLQEKIDAILDEITRTKYTTSEQHKALNTHPCKS